VASENMAAKPSPARMATTRRNRNKVGKGASYKR
jgi:hypothetical protein